MMYRKALNRTDLELPDVVYELMAGEHNPIGVMFSEANAQLVCRAVNIVLEGAMRPVAKPVLEDEQQQFGLGPK